MKKPPDRKAYLDEAAETIQHARTVICDLLKDRPSGSSILDDEDAGVVIHHLNEAMFTLARMDMAVARGTLQ